VEAETGPREHPAPRGGPVDLESFSRIVRRSQERAREIAGLPPGAASSGDRPAPLSVASDDWLAAVEALEVAEEELRQQNEELAATAAEVETHQARYRELFEHAPEAYLVTDAVGAVQEANHAAAALFRIPRDFLRGKPLAVFVDAAARRTFRDGIDRLCRSKGVAHWEMPLRPRYGPRAVVSVAAVASRDARGDVASIKWLLRDVREQHRAAERARAITTTVERRVGERAARTEEIIVARDARIAVLETELAAEGRERSEAEAVAARHADLLATLSHEIRTPLHASQGYLELLQMPETGLLTAKQEEYLRRMQQCQAYLVTVLDGVLMLSRLERGVADLELSDASVDTVLSTIHALVEPQMRERRIRYEHATGDPAVTVRADAEKVQQIVLNLVANAVKFTPAGGLVAVSWEACSDSVAIRVRDSGSGVRPSDLERIFEPFVQGSNARGGVVAGVGLGLAISRQLARLMGGDLTVVSTLGEGATFTVRLPRGPRGDA
jgi:PAS domain S-box-containing protein